MTETAKTSAAFHVAIVSDIETVSARCKAICTQFQYTYKIFKTLDAFMEQSDEFQVIIAGMSQQTAKISPAEIAQAIRFTATKELLICVVDKGLQKEAAMFAKKSGTNLILLENELTDTCKLEFVLTQALQANYLPLKNTDLFSGKAIAFDAYQFDSAKKKFSKFMTEGTIIEESKIKEATKTGPLYLHRDQTPKYRAYVDSHPDSTTAGMARRCRARFLALDGSFLNLIYLLTDQSEVSSFGEGDKLIKTCQTLCEELISSLAEFGNPWEVINSSAVGAFGLIERTPAIAAYTGVFGLQMDIEEVSRVMLVALLSDLGLLFLPPNVANKIREGKIGQLTASELEAYHRYPAKSLEICLDRKLSVDAKLRNIMLSVRERADGKGFPRVLSPEKIVIEAQLIQFAYDFDQTTVPKQGKPNVNPTEALAEMVKTEMNARLKYTAAFLPRLKNLTPS